MIDVEWIESASAYTMSYGLSYPSLCNNHVLCLKQWFSTIFCMIAQFFKAQMQIAHLLTSYMSLSAMFVISQFYKPWRYYI